MKAELIQYDNPVAILLRDGDEYDYPKTELNIEGKKIYQSKIRLQEGDMFVAYERRLPPRGNRHGSIISAGSAEDISRIYEDLSIPSGYTAKTLSTILD